MGNAAARVLEPSGQVHLQIIRKDVWVPEALRGWAPRSHLGQYVRQCLRHLPAEMAVELVERLRDAIIIESALFLRVLRAGGAIEDHGLVCRKKVTAAGCTFIAARMAGTSAANIANFNYHGLGTGTNAESNSDTALQTELTTQYNPNSTRATGTQSTPGSTYIYQTVGTNTVDASAAVTEHGVFDQAATGGGTLLDRSVFSVVNLASADSLQSTYQLTITPEA